MYFKKAYKKSPGKKIHLPNFRDIEPLFICISGRKGNLDLIYFNFNEI